MKNIEKNIKIGIGAILVAMGIASCNYLDRPISSSDVTLNQTFQNIRQVRNWVNNIYTSRVDGYGVLGGAMLSSITDEATFANLSNANVKLLNTGGWNAVTNPLANWGTMYQAIRKANIFLVRRHTVPMIINGDSIRIAEDYNITAYETLKRATGETYFLRAYYYMELVKRYGNVPIIKKPLTLDEEYNLPRNTYQDCIKFINSDLDSAMMFLPENYIGRDNFVGRATIPIVKAYKARLALFDASPLNNPNNDATKWKTAADLHGDFITRYNKANYFDLDVTPLSVFFDRNSKEIIFSIKGGARNDLDKTNSPSGYNSAGAGVNPSQGLVDAFEMKNGKAITDPTSGYDAKNPYLNRDPRFALFINHNGATWKERTVETFVGGRDASSTTNGSLTGYYMRKFLHPTINLQLNQTAERNWVLLRYAEILLNYAEAANEAYGPYVATATNSLTAAQAVELIRKRAGLVPFALPTNLTKDQMRERIRQERRIELAFEDNRYWDVLRWKIADQVFAKPVKGITITKTGTTLTYTYKDVENRTFLPHMHLWPIQRSEMLANKNMAQNPGW